MTITQNIRWAKAQLPFLRLQLKHAIGDSRKKHGQWVKTKKLSDKAAWQISVRKIAPLIQKIAAYESYVEHGATQPSLDIAKGIATFEGGRSADGLFHPYQDPVGVWTIGYGHTAGVCLLYTSDAADDMQCVDLGGRRIIKK